MHIMLDLETLSTQNNAFIASIGAVKFDMNGIHESFLEVIDLSNSSDTKLHIDPATVSWWLGQTKEAQRHLLIPTSDSLGTALDRFNTFVTYSNRVSKKAGADLTKDSIFEKEKLKGMWGNSSIFDNVILRNAYDSENIACPWHFRYDRCYRTLKYSLPNEPFERFGIHHNPLDDAKSQALHLIKLCKKYNINLDRK